MEHNKIQHKKETTQGKFYMGNDEYHSAELTYSNAEGDKLIINHTWVIPKLLNQGIGEQLVVAAVTYALEANLKIIPLCTFAKSVFDHNIGFKDVLMETN